MKTAKELSLIATQIRRDVLRMVHAAQSGHPGGPLGCAEYFSALYFRVLRHNPEAFDIDGHGEDLFFLSNGHLSAGWYSALARSDYFGMEELRTFRMINSRLQGHPATAENLPGVRIASGSLGQGLSVAVGSALCKKLNNDLHLVHVLLGDGELQEGQIWEAAMFAAANKVDNLIAAIDYNGQQIDGPVDMVLALGDLNAKWKSFGWTTLETDGNNLETLLDAIEQAVELTGKGKPVVIIMKTVMGKGVDFMENNHKWHGVPPNDEQLKLALAQLEETLGDY